MWLCVIWRGSFSWAIHGVRVCLMIRTDTTLDKDWGTQSNCVCMYIVHCRVIVDNICEFQQDQTWKIKQKIVMCWRKIIKKTKKVGEKLKNEKETRKTINSKSDKKWHGKTWQKTWKMLKSLRKNLNKLKHAKKKKNEQTQIEKQWKSKWEDIEKWKTHTKRKQTKMKRHIKINQKIEKHPGGGEWQSPEKSEPVRTRGKNSGRVTVGFKVSPKCRESWQSP